MPALPRVLHIEDDAVDRKALERLLGDHADLCQCSTMAAARRVLDQRWNVVLLDLHLPDADSPVDEVLEHLHPGTPLVVVSGASDAEIEDVQSALAGRALVISKSSIKAVISEAAAQMLTPLVSAMAAVAGVSVPAGEVETL